MPSMNPSTKSSWWHNATTEQKLAQIDGGIECGMTSRQIAIASGLHRDFAHLVRQFASSHGVHLIARNTVVAASAGNRRRGDVGRSRRAFLRGEPIDLWGNTEPQEEFLDEREGA